MASLDEDKPLMRNIEAEPSRKRTSSLGSHADTNSSSHSSPELDLRAAASGTSDGGPKPAWTGLRSPSAPPQSRSRMATLTSDSSPATKPVDGEMLLNGQPEPSAADTKPNADHPQIDKLLLDGLAVAKDRLLLLRSDIEMEKLVNDNSRTRLRVAPPGFPPNLNSYQRLLVHRLADMWNIARELEPASSTNAPSQVPAPNAGSMISGTIVLVKTEKTSLPSIRIASLAPPPTPDTAAATTVQPVALVAKISDLSLNTQKNASSPANVSPSVSNSPATSLNVAKINIQVPDSATSVSSLASSSATTSLSASPVPSAGPVRIMSRAANAAAAKALNKSRSPSAGSSTAGMTFEEREAAYQQARMRIFNESQKPSSSPVEQTARPPSMPSTQQQHYMGQSNQHQQQHQHHDQQSIAQQHFSPTQQMPQMQSQIPQIPPPVSQYNPSLRPSAPVFVYQSRPEGIFQQGQMQQGLPQHIAYYPMQQQSGPSMHSGPPIQITMSSPAMAHAQQPGGPQLAYAPYPVQANQPGFVTGQIPFPRPTSAHSHSSQSSISTTTSASSIRTASTSSAQRSTLGTGRGYTSPELNARLMRQFSMNASPSTRQVKPTSRPSVGGSSTHSNSSVYSRHSRTSSSSPSVAGDAAAVLPASAPLTGSKSSGSNIDGKEEHRVSDSPEEVTLAEPHPTLPSRPDWLDSASSSKATSSSASSASSASSKHQTSESTDDPASIQRSDAHTPLSSTSGQASVRGLEDTSLKIDGAADLPSVVEDEAPDARSTPLPHHAVLPDGDSTQTKVKLRKSDRLESSSQTSSTRSSRKQDSNAQPKVIENPPLRYDKVKGWTVLNSNALSQFNQAHQNSTIKQKKPPSPAASVASSSNWSQHAFQPVMYAPNPQFVPAPSTFQNGNVHPQQSQQQYVMMPVPVQSGHPQGGQPQYMQQPFVPQQQAGPSQPIMMHLSPQQGFQQIQHQGQPFVGDMQQFQSSPVQVFYQQPMQHPQRGFQPQPQQQYGQFVSQQQHPHMSHAGGLTPADMMANGEMLYSYDLPRPVPRSGATLFDPNATN